MRQSRWAGMPYALLSLGIACTVFVASSMGLAATITPLASPALQQLAPAPRLAGQGQMRFLGLPIYDAALWVQPGFEPDSFGKHWLALELTYHRTFSSQAIAQRSVSEMERQRSIDPALAQRWTALLTQWLPDVKAGDRLTGVYQPGKGMQLWLGDKDLGALEEPELARHFFGIWLAPQTSEPKLRDALLAKLNQRTP